MFAKLRARPPDDERRHLPTVPRSPDQIDPALSGKIRECVLGDSPWPLFLYGAAGVGKTCAALCMLDYGGGDYYTCAGLRDRIIRVQFGRETWYKAGRGGTLCLEDFWKAIRREPLLVLDELGAREEVKDTLYDAVKQAIDEREGKPLVVISNLDFERIGKLYDDRISSRLAAGTTVQVAGIDRRVRRG